MDKLQTTILAGGRLDCKAILQRCGRLGHSCGLAKYQTDCFGILYL